MGQRSDPIELTQNIYTLIYKSHVSKFGEEPNFTSRQFLMTYIYMIYT